MWGGIELVGNLRQHPRRLALVGASVRGAAQSARAAGFQVVAADLFADADLPSIATAQRIERYPQALRDWLASVRCDAWIYTGGLENHPDLIDDMATLRPLCGNGGDVLRAVRDPLQLQESLAGAEWRFPETRRAIDGVPSGPDWLWKSYRGSGGNGVGAPPHSVERAATGYFQRQLRGAPMSAVFFAGSRRASLAGITRQLVGEDGTGAAPFQYGGSIGPLDVDDPLRSSIARLGETLAERFPLRGVFGVDLIVHNDEVSVVEVNPRYPASAELIERRDRYSIVAAHVSACRSGQIRPLPSLPVRETVCGKAILFAERPLTLSARAAAALLGDRGPETRPRLADIPCAGTAIDAGQPILTVLVDATSPDEVRARLAGELDRIRARLYDAGD